MFVVDKEKERDSYESSIWEKETHQSVAIVIAYIYYAFRQMFTQAKEDSLNNLSLLDSFFLPMFSLALFLFRSCIYNWWAKAQILNIRRDDSWKKASAKEKRREEKRRTKRTNNHLTSFCLYSSYSRQTIVV